ncbi:MAG: toxic anion resistance protein [Cellvibrionaceae bacterium]
MSSTLSEQDHLIVQTAPAASALGLTQPEEISSEEADVELITEADKLIDRLYAVDPKDLREQQRQATSVQTLGHQVQTDIARRSAMLKQPMQRLMRDAEDGSPVAQSLLQLQEQVSTINPNQFDFDVSGFRKLLSKIPGIGTPLSRWLVRYQSVETVIQDVVKSLEAGKAELERDNITLADDQLSMREMTIALEKYVRLGQLVDQRLATRLEGDHSLGDDKRKFLQEEILFPVRQRILDLQQSLAVNQQGVLTSDVIIRNNKELIRGVARSINVTIPALNTAATLALALQTQKKVLDGVTQVTNTTNDLIAQTAEKLKTQGTEIHKQAAGAMLDIDKLKSAFKDVQLALDDISSFRQKALPQMAQSIVEMDQLTGEMEKAIVNVEESRQAREAIEIEL